jgi:hypothetical protein
MYLEWAVPATGISEKLLGYDLTGFGVEGVVVPKDQIPRNVGVPVMLCWRLEPDDDVGASVLFVYQVLDPKGELAGTDMFEAFRPPFFGEKEGDPERIYRPLEISFDVTQEGIHLVRIGERTSPDSPTVELRYSFPLSVSHTQPQRDSLPG